MYGIVCVGSMIIGDYIIMERTEDSFETMAD